MTDIQLLNVGMSVMLTELTDKMVSNKIDWIHVHEHISTHILFIFVKKDLQTNEAAKTYRVDKYNLQLALRLE